MVRRSWSIEPAKATEYLAVYGIGSEINDPLDSARRAFDELSSAVES